MPLPVPALDNRSFKDLRDEGLARIRVHNPEWTNFNKSDPGVTLIEVFAFLAESVIYRANQIPERNRRKFLQLLGVPLAGASAARGLVTFANDRGPLETVTLASGLEVRAGNVAFRVEQGLDVLPVEGRVFVKREVKDPPPELRDYYNQLYTSFLKPELPQGTKLYEAVQLGPHDGVDLAGDTVDRAIWIALLARPADVAGRTGDALAAALDEIRAKIASKTLTLGVVPWLADADRRLAPGVASESESAAQFTCHVPVGGTLPDDPELRVPHYRLLPVVGDDVFTRPGTLQVALPERSQLGLWDNLDPLEGGVGDFPPALDDTNLESRVVAWLRFTVPARTQARLLWAGINAASVSQRVRVSAERLPDGTGAPDQVVRLARRPVLAGSVRLFVTRADGDETGKAEIWSQIDDLADAGAEVPVPDPRLPPGAASLEKRPVNVFAIDAEAGELRFGDGLRGARPPLGAALVADYEFCEGLVGDVNTGAIKSSPELPSGFSVSNPVPTWGGADAETVDEGEKQVQRWVQHRDRMVSAEDFAAITWRTPGVEIGRIDVIPAFSPELGSNEPGDAPGAVTLMVVPRRDPEQPDAPRPDRLFLDSICAWIDPRRLVTTEVYLRGPVYKAVWISVAIDVAVERSIAEVRQAVERELRTVLAPLPPAGTPRGVAPFLPVFTPAPAQASGWKLRKSVVALELAAAAARVPGVTAVRELLLCGDDPANVPSIDMKGLELPRVAGIMVSIGPAMPLADLLGTTPGAGGPGSGGSGAGQVAFVPVPFVPEEC